MIKGDPSDLFHIIEGQRGRLLFAVLDIFPECIVLARLTHLPREKPFPIVAYRV